MLSPDAIDRMVVHGLTMIQAGFTMDNDVEPWEIAVARIAAPRVRISPWFKRYEDLSAWLTSEDLLKALS